MITKPSSLIETLKEENFFPSRRREMHISTYRLYLKKSEEILWQGLKGSVRTAIRSAQKQGIVIDSSNRKQNLKDFYGLYQGLKSHKGISVHSRSFIQRVWQEFSPSEKVKVFVAYKDNLPVAGAFIFIWGKRCEYMWGATKKEYQRFNASQLLHWKIIRWAKSNNFLIYDLGGVPPKKEKGLRGISFFKQSFGGDFVELIGEYEFSPFLISGWIWRNLWPVYQGFKRWAKRP